MPIVMALVCESWFNCQCDSQERILRKDCLDQAGTWACLIVLTKLVAMERPSHHGWHHSPGEKTPTEIRVENVIYVKHEFTLFLGAVCPAAWGSWRLNFPVRMD